MFLVRRPTGLYKLNRLMRKILLICFACFAVALNAAGQPAPNDTSADEIQRDVIFLLLKEDINDVTRQLENDRSSTVTSLLRRLVIYNRAGQPSQVRRTLEQLAATPNWQCPYRHDLLWLIRNVSEANFDTHRFYYTRLCPDALEGAEAFVRLWHKWIRSGG